MGGGIWDGWGEAGTINGGWVEVAGEGWAGAVGGVGDRDGLGAGGGVFACAAAAGGELAGDVLTDAWPGVAGVRVTDGVRYAEVTAAAVEKPAGAGDVAARRGVCLDGGVADRTRSRDDRPTRDAGAADWRGELRWRERGELRRRGHRPDLAGRLPDGQVLPIEVELTEKSSARLKAVLELHSEWIAAGKSAAVIYVCGDEGIAERVLADGAQVGLSVDRERCGSS